MIKIGPIIKISKGKKANLVQNNELGNAFRYIQIDDLRNDENIKYTDSKGVFVTPKDVIIAWDGANAGTVGYGHNGVIGSTLAKLEILSNEVLPKYLARFLRSKSQLLRDKSTGATIPHISRQVLENLEIRLTSLDEQKRVVQMLDQADSLRKKRKTSIDLLDKYLKSTFLEMFGEANSDFISWPNVKLLSLAKSGKSSMRTGPFGSDLKHSEFVSSGIAVIGIDNAVQNKFAWDQRRYITQEKYQNLKRYTLYPKDVIITIMATTGRSAVIPDDIPLSINTKHLAAISLDFTKANPYFISYSIHSDPRIVKQIRGKNIGAIMPGLNLGIIKGLDFKLPPIELQNQFERIMQKTECLRQKMSIQSEEMDKQFQALMHGFFST